LSIETAFVFGVTLMTIRSGAGPSTLPSPGEPIDGALYRCGTCPLLLSLLAGAPSLAAIIAMSGVSPFLEGAVSNCLLLLLLSLSLLAGAPSLAAIIAMSGVSPFSEGAVGGGGSELRCPKVAMIFAIWSRIRSAVSRGARLMKMRVEKNTRRGCCA
jgi:hypothetical protein